MNEHCLASDDTLVHYFNDFLSLPCFPEALLYKQETGVFEVVSEAAECVSRMITSVLHRSKSQLLTDGPTVLARGPPIDNHYTVCCLDKEQGFQWIMKERFPLFTQSDCYFEYRLAKLLSQWDPKHFIQKGDTSFQNTLAVTRHLSSPQMNNENVPKAPTGLQEKASTKKQESMRMYNLTLLPSSGQEGHREIINQTRSASSRCFSCSPGPEEPCTLSSSSSSSSSCSNVNSVKTGVSPSPQTELTLCSTEPSTGTTAEQCLSESNTKNFESSDHTLTRLAAKLVRQVIKDAVILMEGCRQTNTSDHLSWPGGKRTSCALANGSFESEVCHCSTRECRKRLVEEKERVEEREKTGEKTHGVEEKNEEVGSVGTDEKNVLDICYHGARFHGSTQGLEEFKQFLRGTQGEKLLHLWMDIERLKTTQHWERKNRHVVLMRSRYLLSGGQSNLSVELLSRLGLTTTPCWTEEKLHLVQPCLTEALLFYCPLPERFTEEFAKLTALILEKSQAHDNKLEEIRLTTNATDAKLVEFANRISQVEDCVGLLEDINEQQKKNPPVTASEVEDLRQKLDDMENRGRRNNLRFIGVPEGSEKNDTLTFMDKIIPEILNIDFPGGLEIERAHRIGAVRRHTDSEGPPPPPRPIIARFLRFQDRVRIAEAARKMGRVTWKEHRIMVFADYSRLVTEKRVKFNECKKMLHEKRVKVSLDYPAVMTVRSAQGPRRFEDYKKALAYISSLAPRFWTSQCIQEDSIESAHLGLWTERHLRPPSGIDPQPRCITQLPLRPESCLPRSHNTAQTQSCSRSSSSSPVLGSRRMERMLQALYVDSRAGLYFTHFCEHAGNQLWENAVHFWADLQHYRHLFYQDGLDPYGVQRQAQFLYATYLCSSARRSIGVYEETRREVYNRLTPAFEEVFDEVEEHTLAVLLEPWTLLITRDTESYQRVCVWKELRQVDSEDYWELQGLYEESELRLKQVEQCEPTPPLTPPHPDSPRGPDPWIKVAPRYRRYRLGSLLGRRHEIQHFLSFLQDHDASTHLSCWLDLEQYRRTPQKDKAARQQRSADITTKYLNRKYFFGPGSPASTEQQKDIMHLAGGLDRLKHECLSSPVVVEIQSIVRSHIEKTWLPLFLATAEFTERQKHKLRSADRLSEQFYRRQRKRREAWKTEGLWMSSSKEILVFRRVLLNPVTCQQFQHFVSLKGDFLENDVLFWLEVQRYKDLCHSHSDEATIQKKISTIISCFINSSIPPALQIDIPPQQAQRILDKRKELGPYIFREAQMSVFSELLKLWPEFQALRSRVQEEQQLLPLLKEKRVKQRARQQRRRRKEEEEEEEERRAQEELEGQECSFTEEDEDQVDGGRESREKVEQLTRSTVFYSPTQQMSWSYSKYMMALKREEVLLRRQSQLDAVASFSTASDVFFSHCL
ncbi:regulator of G-protein signaling 22 [Polymixia lowei]